MSFMDLFSPESCIVCGEAGAIGLCPTCRKRLDALYDPRPFRCSGGNGYADAMYALFHYDIPFSRSFILDLKTNGYRDSVALFESYYERAMTEKDFPSDFEWVTFCPRSMRARYARGFDQSLLLAQAASSASGKPMEALLSRSGSPRAQHTLSAAARRENVKDTFYGARNLDGANILLIDDVVTTGATASEAARALKKSGAMRVFVLCLAH